MRNETPQIQTTELSDADLDSVSGGVGVSGGGSLTADASGGAGAAGLEITGADGLNGLTGLASGLTSAAPLPVG